VTRLLQAICCEDLDAGQVFAEAQVAPVRVEAIDAELNVRTVSKELSVELAPGRPLDRRRSLDDANLVVLGEAPDLPAGKGLGYLSARLVQLGRIRHG
jgi:hypothetical protein